MKTVSLWMALVLGWSAARAGTPGRFCGQARESIEWCDIWVSHADETNLPRVLLIGDSISRDYYPGVEKRLAGKAFVARLSTSAFISDPVLLREIAMMLDAYRFDVIHFNNGMHGWQHSEQEYRENFPAFLKTIQEHARQARLVWASTTPLKVSPETSGDNDTVATDKRIAARNAIALRFVQAAKIPLDDLNALVRGHPEYHRDNIHFNDRAIDLESAQVAASIEPLLERPPARRAPGLVSGRGGHP